MRCGIGMCLVAAVIGAGLTCGSASAAKPLEVFVSVPPQAYFAERIGGDLVKVHVLVQPGQDPHTFGPTPRQMAALSRARLYLKVGVPFERRLVSKIQDTHRQLAVVDTGKGIKRRRMAAHHHGHPDRHRGHGRHGHDRDEGRDPHIWLSPPLIKTQAKHMADALQKADPGNAAHYQKNLSAFLKDVDATHAKIKKALVPYRGQTFFVFHPAFGYFGDAYGLKQEAVEMEGKSPTPRQLRRLIQEAKRDRVRIVFVQPQFDSKSAEAVARAIGGVAVPMDPLAKDVLKNLEAMAAKIENALRK